MSLPPIGSLLQIKVIYPVETGHSAIARVVGHQKPEAAYPLLVSLLRDNPTNKTLQCAWPHPNVKLIPATAHTTIIPMLVRE